MLFAHLKRYIGVPMMRLRGPKGANEQSQLAATAQDLRKLAKLVPDPAAKSASLPFSITFNNSEPPQLNWSTAMFRKRRTENGEQATEAGRDCLEVTAG